MKNPPSEGGPIVPARSRRYGKIPVAREMTGLSRSAIYRALASGSLRGKKVGKTLLIDLDHALAWISAQPDAQIGATGKTRAGAD